MKKTVLTFGFLSGGVSAALMFATVPFLDRIGFENGAVFGYTAILASFIFVFFGIRSYRDRVLDGRISFGKAVGVGLLITAISTACYVAAWEVIYFNFMPDFGEKYTAYLMAQLKASGATQAVLDAKVQELADFKRMYDNPFINAAISVVEPFPIGVLVTLGSAVVLRRSSTAKPA